MGKYNSTKISHTHMVELSSILNIHDVMFFTETPEKHRAFAASIEFKNNETGGKRPGFSCVSV